VKAVNCEIPFYLIFPFLLTPSLDNNVKDFHVLFSDIMLSFAAFLSHASESEDTTVPSQANQVCYPTIF
jgi:hypothetical protein